MVVECFLIYRIYGQSGSCEQRFSDNDTHFLNSIGLSYVEAFVIRNGNNIQWECEQQQLITHMNRWQTQIEPKKKKRKSFHRNRIALNECSDEKCYRENWFETLENRICQAATHKIVFFYCWKDVKTKIIRSFGVQKTCFSIITQCHVPICE